ncbi:MAG: hypothetical protein EPN25_00270 [Nitrospirae bacterium]|nr:MAG: hypothetical protein EPN25_00270 [Nitrospirota bacterium]
MVFVFCWLLTGDKGWASKPVDRKSQGCVMNGKVYSIYNAGTAYRYKLPQSFNLKPYEGKKVELEGRLSPGDRFIPKGKTLRVLGPCDRATIKLIRKSEAK